MVSSPLSTLSSSSRSSEVNLNFVGLYNNARAAGYAASDIDKVSVPVQWICKSHANPNIRDFVDSQCAFDLVCDNFSHGTIQVIT